MYQFVNLYEPTIYLYGANFAWFLKLTNLYKFYDKNNTYDDVGFTNILNNPNKVIMKNYEVYLSRYPSFEI